MQRVTIRSSPGGLACASRVRPLALVLTALLCAGICAGCTDEPESVMVTPICIDFDPDPTAVASGNVISRKAATSTCNFLDVEIVATDIQSIRSTEIQIRYPLSVAAVDQALVGPLFTGDGSTLDCFDAGAGLGISCVVTAGIDGNTGTVDLFISLTDIPPSTVEAGSDGVVLAVVTFGQLTVLTGASGPLEYGFGKLLNADMPPVAIIDIDPAQPSLTDGTFFGGTMIIR